MKTSLEICYICELESGSANLNLSWYLLKCFALSWSLPEKVCTEAKLTGSWVRACLHFGAWWGRGQEGAVKNTGGRKGMSLVSWVWVWWVGQWGRGRVSTQEEGRAAYKAISVSACREDPHQVKTFPPTPPPPPSHRKKQDLWGIKELVDLFLFANEASGQYGRQNSRRVVERFRPANTHSIIFRDCEKLHLT